MEKQKLNGRYITIIVAAGMLCAVMAFRQSCVSVFVAFIAETYSATTTAVMTFISVFNIAALITTAFWGKWCQEFGLTKCVAVAGLMVAVAMAGWALSPSLIVFFVFSAVAGAFHAGCGVIPASIAVTQWFEEKHGTIMGIVTTFISIGGVLGNAIFPRIIVSSGWSKAMLCMAIATLIGTVPFAFFLKPPAAYGMTAYGSTGAPKANAAEAAAELPGITAKAAMKLPLFYILWIGMLLVQIPNAWMNNLPIWALQNGMDTTQSGLLLSFIALGGIATTLLIGISNDKLGSKKTTALFLGIGLIALLGYTIAKSFGVAVLICFLFAVGLAFTVTMPQIICAAVFGQKEYGQLFANLSLAQSVAMIIGAPGISLMYDLSGSYNPALIAMAVMWLLAILIVIYSINKGKRLQQD